MVLFDNIVDAEKSGFETIVNYSSEKPIHGKYTLVTPHSHKLEVYYEKIPITLQR